jgi:DNA-binding HxlR family transcriptional regulator
MFLEVEGECMLVFIIENALPLLAFCKHKLTPLYLQSASIHHMGNCNTPIEHRSNCAVTMALDTVGDKWSLLILRDLMFTDKRTYTDLQTSKEGIATNIPAARLVSLEGAGIIRKEQDPENGRRHLFFLTEKGIGLLPVVMELMVWTAQFNKEAVACADHLNAYKKDRNAALKEREAKLRKEHLKRKERVN